MRPRSDRAPAPVALGWAGSALLHAGLLGIGTLAAASTRAAGPSAAVEEATIEIRLVLPGTIAPARGGLVATLAPDHRSEPAAYVPPDFEFLPLAPELEDEPFDPLSELAREEHAEVAGSRRERLVLAGRVGARAAGERAASAGGGPGEERAASPGDARASAGAGGNASSAGVADGSTEGDPSRGLRLLSAPDPEYPRDSIRRGEEGSVRCAIAIDLEGRVLEVEVLAGSGHPALDRAAVAGLRRWRFEPARSEGGEPIPARIVHVVTFRLR